LAKTNQKKENYNMTKKTKTWKIGECCAGGVIRAKSCGEFVKLEIRDYFTDELLNDGAFGRIHIRQIREFLENSTTPYYADKVLQWIINKVWGLA
jgi:hypothetical protein